MSHGFHWGISGSGGGPKDTGGDEGREGRVVGEERTLTLHWRWACRRG